MTIIQALENTTTRLEQYDAQMKSGISHERAEVILAESEKMEPVFREAEFYIKRPDLFGNQAHLIKPLNKALSIYVRVVQGCIDHGFQACDEKTDKISRHLIQRLAELEKEIEDAPRQPIVEALEGNLSLLTLLNLPNELLKKIFGSLGEEFLIVLKFTCKTFNNAIQLKKKIDPIRITAQGPVLFSTADFCAKIASQGFTNLLKWAKENGCPWNNKTCAVAALNGHLETLMWARANDCPWDASTCSYAAVNGHLEILMWARANGCPWNEMTCVAAATKGHLEILQWARANGCPWGITTCAMAAQNGHLEILQWVRANGCPWDAWTCSFAAENGQLETLIWARANGCSWDIWTCANAAKNGHLEILKWARANGCPWDTTTCVAAAVYGHLQVLQWARTNGCPWDEFTCAGAAEKGHLAILQWARANGAPWNEENIRRNAQAHPEVLKWLDGLETA